MVTVSIINASTVVSDADLSKYVHALQIQVNKDFAPIWGVVARLVFVPKGHSPAAGTWWLSVMDDSDTAGALGYHDMTSEGLPAGKVFAKTDLTYGSSVSVTLSHELLEMLADPWIFSTVFVPHTTIKNYVGPVLYALEVCDACEDDKLGYKINDVLVSDFQYPAWFDGVGTKFDHMGHIDAPFKILPGGYMSIMKVVANPHWTQINLEGHFSRVGNAAVLGSRRERRNSGKDCWKISTVIHEGPIVSE